MHFPSFQTFLDITANKMRRLLESLHNKIDARLTLLSLRLKVDMVIRTYQKLYLPFCIFSLFFFKVSTICNIVI